MTRTSAHLFPPYKSLILRLQSGSLYCKKWDESASCGVRTVSLVARSRREVM